MATLTPAQQLILDGIEMHWGIYDIPSFRLDQQRSARSLEKKGLVHCEVVAGGTLRVTKTMKEHR
jgi:hypothetical protein